ncbi:MAG: hypothetical protein H8E66_10155 [Planctomycetes bacterium]|nr:hypothetical protein [Planctomycetota bacterium]
MLRIGLTLVVGISTVLASNAIAQPRGNSRGGPGASRGAGGNLPKIGTTLPDITLYDDSGEEISTTSLRGQYSVLVFGCLT